MRKIKICLAFVAIVLLASCAPSRTLESSGDEIQNILALGDSYTIGESVPESGRWPVQLREKLEERNASNIDLKIIAKTGWRTDELRQAVEGQNLNKKYDLVTLLIGVNNQYQGKSINDYPNEFTQCLEQAISFARSKKDVVVVSIPDYAFTPFGQTRNPKVITEEIDQYNEINQRISKNYGVKYVYITDVTRQGIEDPDLVASDGLHPSAKCYSLFVPRIIDVLQK